MIKNKLPHTSYLSLVLLLSTFHSSLQGMEPQENNKKRPYDLANLTENIVDSEQPQSKSRRVELPPVDLNALKIQADQGNQQAQVKLGWMYYRGKDIETIDFQQAFTYFKAAADLGNAHGQYYLGMICENGHGIQKNFKRALFYYDQASKQNHENAKIKAEILRQHIRNYEPGKDKVVEGEQLLKEQKFEEAFQAFQEACYVGNPNALYHLGNLYKKINKDIAFQYYTKAAEKGHELADAEAYYYLGKMSEENDIPNFKRAEEAYLKAAQHKHKKALYKLGLMYLKGKGNDHSTLPIKRAILYFKSAAVQDHPYAGSQYQLGLIYENINKISKSRVWLKNAADQGHRDAQFHYGFSFIKYYNLHGPVSRELFMPYLEKAAAQGHQEATLTLARIHCRSPIPNVNDTTDNDQYNFNYQLGVHYILSALKLGHRDKTLFNQYFTVVPVEKRTKRNIKALAYEFERDRKKLVEKLKSVSNYFLNEIKSEIESIKKLMVTSNSSDCLNYIKKLEDLMGDFTLSKAFDLRLEKNSKTVSNSLNCLIYIKKLEDFLDHFTHTEALKKGFLINNLRIKPKHYNQEIWYQLNAPNNEDITHVHWICDKITVKGYQKDYLSFEDADNLLQSDFFNDVLVGYNKPPLFKELPHLEERQRKTGVTCLTIRSQLMAKPEDELLQNQFKKYNDDASKLDDLIKNLTKLIRIEKDIIKLVHESSPLRDDALDRENGYALGAIIN